MLIVVVGVVVGCVGFEGGGVEGLRVRGGIGGLSRYDKPTGHRYDSLCLGIELHLCAYI